MAIKQKKNTWPTWMKPSTIQAMKKLISDIRVFEKEFGPIEEYDKPNQRTDNRLDS